MPRFTYEVRQPTGVVERGTTAGESAQAVARALQAEGYYVIQIQPLAARPMAPSWETVSRRVLAPVFFRVSSKSLGAFFASLRSLLSAGMNISEAMTTLSRRTGNRTLRRAAYEMGEEAVRGRPMSGVLGRFPAAFGPATRAMIETGEDSGFLERAAGRLAEHFDRAHELEMAYRWNTFYPKILVLALIVLPTIPTLVMGTFNQWLGLLLTRSLPTLAAVFLLWYGWRLLLLLPWLSRALDRLKLLVPWFGSLTRRTAVARWARSLSMLSSAGVPVHRALLAAAAATGNRAIEASLVREAEGVLHGRTLSEVAQASAEIPGMAVDMLATAEKAGSIDSALDKVAEYYESETDVGGKQTAVAVGVGFYLLIAFLIAIYVIGQWGSYIGQIGSYGD